MKKYPESILRLKDRRGVMIVIVGLMLPVLLGCAAFAIDIGYVMVLRNELQNAADAAALAGTRVFCPNTPSASPNWTAAQREAADAIRLNKAAGTTLTDCQVQTGYWNLSRTPFGLQDKNIIPCTKDAPVVKVTVSRSPGNNGGPVPLFFGPILGTNYSSVSAEAIAVMASPGTAEKGRLLPVAISKEMADRYRNYLGPNTFRIGSPYHYPNLMAGQWTSLDLDTNNVHTFRDLLQYGNPNPLSVGDMIWIQPGTQTTLYDNKNQPSISWYIGQDVVLPVVDSVLRDDTHSEVPIYAFIGFHITDAVGGSQKYIEGYFTTGVLSSMGPVGPDYGLYTPPRLVY